MQWHLNYTPPKADFTIDHEKKIFLIGSCFAENIGKYLSDYRFKVLSNPSGILFNPKSIHTCLENCIDNSSFEEKFILSRNDLYYSFLHHSSVNDTTREGLMSKINAAGEAASKFLRTADFLIITFGSAFVYEHKGLFEIVSNCHKQPATHFNKKILKVDEIVKTYEELILLLRKVNPGIKIIFTVSPVKYLKDGFEENSLSKSTLLLAVNELCTKGNHHYFPAYELVSDDLRDYRFYNEDMAHPNEQAIKYVWEKFSECFFGWKTKDLNQTIHKLNSALNHKPINGSGEEAQKLAKFISAQKQLLKAKDPNIQL